MEKYPCTDLQTTNLDWLLLEVKRLAKANGIEFDDEYIQIGAGNVQEAIDALYNLVIDISSQTNAVEIIDSSIIESAWLAGYTYNHLQTVNTPTLMAIINAMRLNKYIILRRDVATNDEVTFILLEVTYDPILFKHELKLVNPHKVATLDIFGLDDDANVYAQILPDTTVKYVNTFNGRSGSVTPAAHDYAADQVDYNNEDSGIEATNVQDAIDEVDNKIPSNIVETFNERSGEVVPAAHDYAADQVDYNNEDSGLAATNVQDAIDEMLSNPPAPSAAGINYSNATSGLQATNVQDAIDEIADDVLSSGVASFNGRVGAVTPAAHDYNAAQIDYNNTASDLNATNSQDAIDELAAAIPIDELRYLSTETGNPISITADSAQIARSTKITLKPIQASGTPTPSNPLPISGYDVVELDGCGKNLFNPSNLIKGTFSDAQFNVTNVGSTIYRSYKAYLPKGTYTISFDKTVVAICTIVDGIYSSSAETYTSKTYTLVNDGWFGLSWRDNTSSSTDWDDTAPIQLEVGSTATLYEHYIPITRISHSFPTTIYGGEVDVERGVLKVTHGIVDLGEFSWVFYPHATFGDYFYANIASLGVKFQNFIIANPNNKLTDYQIVGRTTQAFTDLTACLDGDANNNVTQLQIKDSNYNDGTIFKTSVTGQKFCYELATPYEIPLTPRLVNLLQGANVITTNGTSIEITYRNGTIATLTDVGNLNRTIDALATIASGTKSADQITSGTFGGQVKANPTAMANLETAQVRDIIITDSAPVVGSSTTIPDGTLIVVYE